MIDAHAAYRRVALARAHHSAGAADYPLGEGIGQ